MRALSALCLAVSFAAASARAAAVVPLPLGAAAPDFNLPGVDDRNWSLKDFSGAKVLVVLFTCNHCPTAQYYEERIKQIVSDYSDRGVRAVAIMPNDAQSIRLDELAWTDLSDSFAEMKTRATDRHYNFPYLYDGELEAVSRAYGPAATPHAFVFDSERKLRYAGAIDDSERPQHVTKHYLRDALEALLAGQDLAVKQTKVVGCSIKWAGKSQQVKNTMAKLAAEPVALTNVDAAGLRSLRTNANSGKLRLVSVWATWCAPCVAEFNEFVTINRIYRKRDFEFVSVSMNRPDEAPQVLKFLQEQQASNRNLIFASADRDALINAFNPDWQGEVPYTVLIEPNGSVVYSESGSVDPLALKRAIVKSLNERKPW